MLGVIMVSHYLLPKERDQDFWGQISEGNFGRPRKIHSMGIYETMDATKLTKNYKQQDLNSPIFVTEKRDGRIKSRKCAIYSKHCNFDGYNKANGSSPTVSTKGIIQTAAIYGHFGRDVATIDITNALLWDDNNGEVLMKLCGKMVELLVAPYPSLYIKYVVGGENGEPVLYVKLSKVLYGLLRPALLFHKKLRKELEDMDFKINPYEPCIPNNMVNGSQITVTWYVDDLKISHK